MSVAFVADCSQCCHGVCGSAERTADHPNVSQVSQRDTSGARHFPSKA
jgi:hypothetical protein